MADDSGLPQQIESVERSIVFLRQEHLTMLHGLRMELLSLHKRCTALTTELKLKLQEETRSDLHDEEVLLELRCSDMEKCLHEEDCYIGELRTELGLKGSLVGALRANLKEKERSFLEELKRRSHFSTLLNTELQKQAEAAAYLSFQLHAARQKLHHQRLRQRQKLSVHSQGAHYEPGQNFLLPQMPSEAVSPVVKPKRKNAKMSQRVQWTRECVPMEKVLGPAEPTAMPDPALFLNPRWHRARQRDPGTLPPLPLGREKENLMGNYVEETTPSQKPASSAAVPPAAETNTD
ncbi:unnamed protein product [Knipowitschia caucasica]|uniref:CCDC92/74 N-terminal domain-containing protein n=1 Tax=Knipowitschia caucasica TaxID=637954 RepID=A0AAV2J4T8_KNICA